MKAVLVVDMPKNCEECKLTYVNTRKDTFCCCLTDEEIEYRNDKENRDVSCPLRPLPSKLVPFGFLDVGNEDGLYEKGWNNCLDEITDHIGESTEKVCNDDLYESWMFFDEGETE